MQLDADELRQKLEPLFRENFENFGELGAAVSIWQNGRSIVDLHGGFRDARREKPWSADTLALIWSATKGLGSACLLHALQENKIDIERRVAEIWPEFAQAGKGEITLAQLLSHSAGLAALDRRVDVRDYPAVIDAIEKQTPNWEPGTEHGYHARTFGFLLDELVRRISGKTLPEYWRRIFAGPLDLDLWIGLPEEENSRVATMVAAKARKPADGESKSGPPVDGRAMMSSHFYADLAKPDSFARKVFTSPQGLNAVSEMNKPENRALPIVSFGGIGTARSLAKFYAMLVNGGGDFFAENTIGWMTTTLADGVDRVFQIPTAFSAGFMKEPVKAQGAMVSRRLFGNSASSFGHPGAGGSHAFADLETGIGFAYVMNQMEQSVLPNDKSLRLVNAIYGRL